MSAYLIRGLVVDPHARSVGFYGSELSMPPAAIKVLIALVGAPGGSLTRKSLVNLTSITGSDASLNQAVYQLRCALRAAGIDPDEIVVTEPWRGYRLASPAHKITTNVRTHRSDLDLAEARLLCEARTSAALKRARLLLLRSLSRDPSTEAMLSLAQVQFLVPALGFGLPCESIPKALQICENLIRRKPVDGRPMAVKALIFFSYLGQRAEAEELFRLAVKISPDSALVRHWFAKALACSSRTTEALRQAKIALSLQPLSLAIRCDLAQIELQFGAARSALRTIRPALEINPSYARANVFYATALEQISDRAIAVKTLSRVVSDEIDDPMAFAWAGASLACLGEDGRAEHALRQLSKRRESGNPFPWFAEAMVHKGLGDKRGSQLAKSKAGNALDASRLWSRLNPLANQFLLN